MSIASLRCGRFVLFLDFGSPFSHYVPATVLSPGGPLFPYIIFHHSVSFMLVSLFTAVAPSTVFLPFHPITHLHMVNYPDPYSGGGSHYRPRFNLLELRSPFLFPIFLKSTSYGSAPFRLPLAILSPFLAFSPSLLLLIFIGKRPCF
jgi:hypothetical protein